MKRDDEIRWQYSAVENAKRAVEEQVVRLDGWAKESADKGDYSNAGSHQKSAVDLHCAVAIIEEAVFPHHHSRPGFSRADGDVCPGCERDDWLAKQGTSKEHGDG